MGLGLHGNSPVGGRDTQLPAELLERAGIKPFMPGSGDTIITA
jgi:hypothetical protein